jgi:hypothetical protein
MWAQHDRDHVLVFQAFRPEIGSAAVSAGTLAVPGFGLDRATWIKPSFLWMMHRSAWGRAEGQEVTLGIYVARTWFEDALGQAVLSSAHGSGEGGPHTSTQVVVQWDPDWDASDHRQPWRAIQVGLRPAALRGYLTAIVGCVDLSEHVSRGREQRLIDGRLMVPDAEILEFSDPATRQRLGVDWK